MENILNAFGAVGGLAQAIAPFGIVFLIILISGLLENQNKDEKNKKRKI